MARAKKPGVPRRRAPRSAAPKGKEFAILHADGTVSDLELWRDILPPDEIAEIEAILAKRKPKSSKAR